MVPTYCQLNQMESKENETGHIRTIDYNFDEEMEPQVDLVTWYGHILLM